MSLASHAINRLRELYRVVLLRMRMLNSQLACGAAVVSPRRFKMVEALEPRLLLRGALDALALTGGGTASLVAAPGRPEGAPERLMAHLHDATVTALTKLAELRDTETGEHLMRMRSYTQIVAGELGQQLHGPTAVRHPGH